VLNTYLIYLRFELLRGHLTREHAHEVARVRKLLADSTGGALSRIRGRVARAVKPGEIQEADVVGSRPRRPRHRAHRRQGRVRRRRVARRARHACASSSAGARWTRRLGRDLGASPDRVAPKPARTFGFAAAARCSILSPAAQLAAKQAQLLDNLERIGRVTPERMLAPLRGPEWGYRRRARLGVKYVHKKGRVLAGFREREKPYLADIRHCEVLVPPLRTLPEDSPRWSRP
jgi:hypothetical protein